MCPFGRRSVRVTRRPWARMVFGKIKRSPRRWYNRDNSVRDVGELKKGLFEIPGL